MARMSIYIGDELKARIDAIGDKINWSGVAQIAFDRELETQTFPKEPTMENVIERLKSSKLAYVERERIDGIAEGREWAMKYAEFPDLKLMSKIDPDDTTVEFSCDYLAGELGYEDPHDFWGDEYGSHSPEFLRGYVEGAIAVWDEVESAL